MPSGTTVSYGYAARNAGTGRVDVKQIHAGDETPARGPSPPKVPIGPITGVHPLAWVTAGILVLALVFQIAGTDYLIGNLSWWHWVLLGAMLVISIKPIVLHRLRLALEKLSDITGTLVWILAWVVFVVQLFNVVTRYGNRLVDQDILIGQATSVAWQSFALIALLGLNHGVRAGVNPRIDFWWADFSAKRKAWLDFVIHVMLLLPFVIMSVRILTPYAASSLGRKGSGAWGNGWQVWKSWERSADADQLAVGPIKAMLLVAFALFGLQILAEVIKSGFVMMGHPEIGDVQEHDAPLRVE